MQRRSSNQPPDEDIRQQLRRMLDNAAFSSRPQQAKLFSLAVEESLIGNDISEKFLRERLFPTPPYKADSNIARKTIDLVKKLLIHYYEAEGANDPILIAFPEPEPAAGKRIKFQAGEAYKPVFRFNENHDRAKALKDALSTLDDTLHLNGEALAVTLDELERLTVSDNKTMPYAPAFAVRAEAVLLASIFNPNGMFTSPKVALAEAESLAAEALRLQSQTERAHRVLGAIYACRFEWQRARANFDLARVPPTGKIESDFWQVAFLIALGKTDEANAALAERWNETQDDPATALIGALLAYLDREYVLADWLILKYFAKNVNAYFCFEHGHGYTTGLDTLGFNMDFEEFEANSDSRTCFLATIRNELAATLRGLICLARNLPHLALIHISGYRHPGLRQLATSQAARQPATGADSFLSQSLGSSTTPEQPSPDTVDRALSFIALEDHQAAIRMLEKACDEHHPAMTWLHLWPIFDVLRIQEGFQQLIARLRIPASV